MQTIKVTGNIREDAWQYARKGDIWHVLLHGVRWPAELRNSKIRIRLLENSNDKSLPVDCELLDPWPGAPKEWPDAVKVTR